jgi:methylenetetrahydrofolate--tRNA-(uracil-5-)-methyltransferase
MLWPWTGPNFHAKVTEAISREPLITIRREEVTHIEDGQFTMIATGPLTSDALSQKSCAEFSSPSAASRPAGRGRPRHPNNLYFYDSISPIVEADSIDMSKVYLAARYDKGSADYINCPMSKEEYDRLL